MAARSAIVIVPIGAVEGNAACGEVRHPANANAMPPKTMTLIMLVRNNTTCLRRHCSFRPPQPIWKRSGWLTRHRHPAPQVTRSTDQPRRALRWFLPDLPGVYWRRREVPCNHNHTGIAAPPVGFATLHHYPGAGQSCAWSGSHTWAARIQARLQICCFLHLTRLFPFRSLSCRYALQTLNGSTFSEVTGAMVQTEPTSHCALEFRCESLN